MLEKFYLNSPLWIQNIMVLVKGFYIKKLRINSTFKKEYKNALSNQLKSSEEIEAIQNERLSEFIKFSNHSEYWNKKFNKYNVDINAINIKEEINKLPILTKDEVKTNLDKITNNVVKGKLVYISTSGTTGSGMTFPQTQEMVNRQWAIWWAYRKLHDIELDTWCGWFGSKNIVSPKQVKPPFWKVNYFGKQIMFSAFHLNKETAKLYFEEINRRKLKWLHGYPSQLSLFASFVLELKLKKLESLKIITIGAESLYDYQKEIIEKAFKVPVRQHYGLAEGVVNISEDTNSNLKIDHEFSYTEIMPVEKKSLKICKVIGTNFSNFAFPLIRYDTNDLAEIEYTDNGQLVIKKIIGRSSTFLTLGNGQRFGPISYLFKKMSNVKEAQVYQPNYNELIFRIVKNDKFTDNDEKVLLEEINKRLKDQSVIIKIVYLKRIKRTNAGKLNAVISDVEKIS